MCNGLESKRCVFALGVLCVGPGHIPHLCPMCVGSKTTADSCHTVGYKAGTMMNGCQKTDKKKELNLKYQNSL